MIFGRQVGVFKELIELVLNGRFGSKAAAQYEPNSSTRAAGFGVKRTVATQRRRLLPGVKRTSTLQFKAQHGRNIFAQNN